MGHMRQPPGGTGLREVEVWFVELAANPEAENYFRDFLSADEKERAARFRFAHLTSSFTLARGALRVLLSRYVGAAPGEIRFGYGARGKPYLVWPPAGLGFNLAHSGKLACFAFAAGCEVGVDIEQIRPMRDRDQLVRRFFSREESEEWLTLDESQRGDAFFRCWTRKEAYIKAVGDGLSIPLDSFRVSLRPDEPAALLDVKSAPGEGAKWAIHSLSPGQGYAGALALPDRSRGVRIFPPVTADALLENGV